MSKIHFKKSNTTIDFDGSDDNILEAAEGAGLSLDFGCRMGNCTACQQPLLNGEIEYPEGHAGEPDEGNELICCSIPTTDVTFDA